MVLDRVREATVGRGVLADADHLLMASAMVAMWTDPTLLPPDATALLFGVLALVWSTWAVRPVGPATSWGADVVPEPGRSRRHRVVAALRGAVTAPADHPSHLVLVNAATALMFLLMAHPAPSVLGPGTGSGMGMAMGTAVDMAAPATSPAGVGLLGTTAVAAAVAVLGLYLCAHAASLVVRRTDRRAGRSVATGTVAFHVLMGLSMGTMLVGSI